jgi:topoisomerase IA-like protein
MHSIDEAYNISLNHATKKMRQQQQDNHSPIATNQVQFDPQDSNIRNVCIINNSLSDRFANLITI